MSLGSYVDIQAGSRATMQCYNAAADECCNKCGADCTIGLTGVTTFMFGFTVLEPGFDPLEGFATDSTVGIYIRATIMTGQTDKQEIEFDLMNGTALTVPACVFTPTIIYPEVPLLPGGRAPRFRVHMSVGKGYGMRGRASHARRTFAITLAAGATSEPIVIPNFADAVSFNSDQDDVTNVRILQYANSLGGGGATLDSSVMGKNEDESVPYAPGARSFAIINETAEIVTYYVSWRLAFG